jgi:hypothetical protein
MQFLVVTQPHDQLSSAASDACQCVRIPQKRSKWRTRSDDPKPAGYLCILNRRATQTQVLSDGFVVLRRAQHPQPHEGLLHAISVTIANRRWPDAHHVTVRLLKSSQGSFEGNLTFGGYQQAARPWLECSAVILRQQFYCLPREGELESLGPMRAAPLDRIIRSHDSCVTPERCGYASHPATLQHGPPGQSQ